MNHGNDDDNKEYVDDNKGNNNDDDQFEQLIDVDKIYNAPM